MNRRLLMIVEIAIFASLAYVLDFLKLFTMPYGGSVTLGMIPIFIVAFRWGVKAGLASGFLFGSLQMLYGGYVIDIVQGIFEYPFAFTVVGLAGLFSKPIIESIKNNHRSRLIALVTTAVLVGCAIRFVGHLIAGVIWFEHFTPDEFESVWTYSLVYNSYYMIPNFILATVILLILLIRKPNLMFRKP